MQQWNKSFVVYEMQLHMLNSPNLPRLSLPAQIILQKILFQETNKRMSSLKLRKGIHFILS